MSSTWQARSSRIGLAIGLVICVVVAPASSQGLEALQDFVIESSGSWEGAELPDGTIRLHLQGGVRLNYADLEVHADRVVLWFRSLDGDAPDGASGLGRKWEEAGLYAEGEPALLLRGLGVAPEPGDFQIQQALGDWIFLDLLTASALVQSAMVRSLLIRDDRDVPLIVRAERVRITPTAEILGRDPALTTCELGEPHWAFHPRWVAIKDGSRPGTRRIEASGSRVEIGGIPVMVVPWIAGEVGGKGLGARVPLQRVKFGSTNAFGAFLQTDWGGDLIDGVKWRVEADGYTDRGLAAGVDLMWEILGGGGFVDTYVIDDHGEDNRFPERDRDLRGRVRLAHRQPLTEHLRLDLELSYLSDRSFLDEYFESEAKTGKRQETDAYLRYADGDIFAAAVTKLRINEFETTTEKLPALRFQVAETPLFDGLMYYDSASELAWLRRRFDNDLDIEDVDAWRHDSTHVVGAPVRLGAVGAEVFGGVRNTGWDDSPGDDGREGGGDQDRTAGIAGGRAAVNFARVYDVELPAFGINRLRHIVTPEVSYLDVFGVGTGPEDLLFFDGVESLRSVRLLEIGLINRLQTRTPVAGSTETVGETDGRFLGSAVDVLYLDARVRLFPDADRDNNGDILGEFETDLTLRISPGLDLLARAVVGGGDRPTLDELSAGLDWRRSFGLSRDEDPVERSIGAYLGHRHRAGISSTTSLDLDAWIDARWSTRLLVQYDWLVDRMPDAQIELSRHYHDFSLNFGVTWDDGEDDLGFGVSFSLRDLQDTGRRYYDAGSSPSRDLRDRDAAARHAPEHLDPGEAIESAREQ